MVGSGIPQAVNPALFLLLSGSDVFLHERIFKVMQFNDMIDSLLQDNIDSNQTLPIICYQNK